MKVTHVFRSFPNKNQPYNKVLVERLLKKGVICRVVSFGKASYSGNLKIDSLQYHRISWPKYVLKTLLNLQLFKKYYKQSRSGLKQSIFYFGRFSKLLEFYPDVIHIHHIQVLTLDFLTFLDITNIKCIVSIRGGDVLVRPYRSDADMQFLLRAVEKVKNVHYVSQHLETNLKNLTSVNLNSFVIRRSPEIDIGLKKLPEVGLPKIITIGRIHWTKGYKYALEALSMLKLDGFKFQYHICGSGSIEQTDELIYLIKQFDLKREVILEGHLSSPELNDLMGRSSLYLQSSLSEGIPNTLLRALFLRIPIVTTEVGGVPEVFDNGNDGIMVDKADSQRLFEAIKKIFTDKEFQNNIRSKKSSKLSNPENEIENYIKMYKSIH